MASMRRAHTNAKEIWENESLMVDGAKIFQTYFWFEEDVTAALNKGELDETSQILPEFENEEPF